MQTSSHPTEKFHSREARKNATRSPKGTNRKSKTRVSSVKMNYGPLISKILLSFILAATVLYRYGNWFRHHIIVTLIVLLAWYFSFLIIFALPLDVISVSKNTAVSCNIIIIFHHRPFIVSAKKNMTYPL